MTARFALFALAALGAACSDATAPALRGGGEGEATAPTEPAADPSEPADEADAEAPAAEIDASATPDASAGADAAADAGPPPNAFTGAPAYASTLGPSTRKAAHPFTNDDPAGRACFNCHGSTATSFAFAGTVYANAAGTQRAARVEVRVRDKDGKAISAFTNADGNFFFLLEPSGDLALPGHAGIRDAAGTKLMTATTASGDCNSCHKAGAGAAGRLVAP